MDVPAYGRGVLSSAMLYLAEHLGLFQLENHLQFKGTSCDIRVKRILEMRPTTKPIEIRDGEEIPSIDDLFAEKPLVKESWLLEPGGFYIAEMQENCYKGIGTVVSISSRSSWARYGVQCGNITDEFDTFTQSYTGPLFVRISMMNTAVLLRPHDAPAQVRVAVGTLAPLFRHELEQVQQHHSVVTPTQLVKDGFGLSRSKSVRVYRGGIIDPKKPCDAQFETTDASEGITLPFGTFYISGSREQVHIPPAYIGYLHPTNYQGNKSGSLDVQGSVSEIQHANAPFIDPLPRFQGSVTFEQLQLYPRRIKEGDRLADLQLIPLWKPDTTAENISSVEQSRYHGQEEAQLSKGHIIP